MNKKAIIGIIVAGLIALMIGANFFVNSEAGAAVFGGTGGGFQVKVTEIQKGDISSYISANGIIQEVEKAEVYFDAPVKINRVLVSEGDRVTRGQQLLAADMSSLVSEMEKLKTNRSIQELSLNPNVANAEVNSAKSAVEKAEKTYNDSLEELGKSRDLYESNIISKSEFEKAEKAVNSSKTALEDARKSYELAVESKNVKKTSTEENIKIIDISIKDLEAKMKRMADAQASPMDGVVTAMRVEAGGLTGNGQPAYKVINPDKLQVKAKIKEYDIKNVKVGQIARITGDAIDKEKVINGRVTAISPVAVVSRTTSGEETVIEVTITVDNPEGILKPGLNVTCDIYTVDKKDVIVAPMEIFTEDKDGNKLVYVVDMEQKTMRETPVKLGIYSDMTVEVLDGLKEGDMVIIEPQPMYKDGAKVKIKDQG